MWMRNRVGYMMLIAVLAVVVPCAITTAEAVIVADLSVSVSVSPPSGVGTGGNLTYTALVSNGGPGAATDISLVTTLPSGIIPISVRPDGACVFRGNGSMVNCALGTLANGANKTVTIVVHPIAVGMKTTTVAVAATETDPNSLNNNSSVSSSITEVAISDVKVTLLDAPDPLNVGEPLTYTATVTNIGDDDAHDVVLTLAFAGRVRFVSVTPAQGTCRRGSLVSCKLGTLGNGAAVLVTIEVVPLDPGFLYATAGVAVSTADPDITNNSASARTFVNP